MAIDTINYTHRNDLIWRSYTSKVRINIFCHCPHTKFTDKTKDNRSLSSGLSKLDSYFLTFCSCLFNIFNADPFSENLLLPCQFDFFSVHSLMIF